MADLENDGFNVVEPEIMDLTDVKEEKQLVPPAKGVKFLISKAKIQANDNKTWKWIALTLVIVDGIEVEGKMKFANKPMYQNVCYYAEPSAYASDWFRKKQHLVPLKQLLTAVGADLAKVKIDDMFGESLTNQLVLADIKQTADTEKDSEGKRVKTGEFSNEIVNFKAVSAELLV